MPVYKLCMDTSSKKRKRNNFQPLEWMMSAFALRYSLFSIVFGLSDLKPKIFDLNINNFGHQTSMTILNRWQQRKNGYQWNFTKVFEPSELKKMTCLGAKCLGAKCLGAKCLGAKCLGAKCLGVKFPGAKCPGTKWHSLPNIPALVQILSLTFRGQMGCTPM